MFVILGQYWICLNFRSSYTLLFVVIDSLSCHILCQLQKKSGIEDFSQNPSRVRNVLSFLISESSPSFGIKFERLWNPHSVFPYFPRLPQSSVTKIVLLDPSSMARTGSAAAVMRESVLMTYLAPRQVENPDKHPNFCLFIWTKLGFWTNWASHQWFCHP